MSGRSRRKKLVRTRRLSKSDSVSDSAVAAVAVPVSSSEAAPPQSQESASQEVIATAEPVVAQPAAADKELSQDNTDASAAAAASEEQPSDDSAARVVEEILNVIPESKEIEEACKEDFEECLISNEVTGELLPPPLEVVKSLLEEDIDDDQEVTSGEEASADLVRKAASSWRAALDMGDTSGHNPKWRRVAVRAVQLQETGRKAPNAGAPSAKVDLPADKGGSSNKVTSNHVNKAQTGNGGLRIKSAGSPTTDVIPPPPILPGGVPQPSPPGITPPPGPWGDHLFATIGTIPPAASNTNQNQRHYGYDTDTESVPSSSHSSVLVDMGKVVGVLRAHVPQDPREPERDLVNQVAHGRDYEEEEDEDRDNDDDDDDMGRDHHEEDELEEVLDNGCASCAAAAAAAAANNTGLSLTTQKSTQQDVLDDSLCGDPLMYATFVAPVHQYSTETEPSRQTSFNYPSRQPSFKQNSSEADGSQPPESCAAMAAAPFPGLPVTAGGCGSADTPERVYVDDVQDIYAEVPEVDQWPLPPLPPSAKDAVVEISHEELEHQVHLERMSFISGSSANEDEDDDDDERHLMAPAAPPPPLPPKPAVLLNQQPRGLVEQPRTRESTPMIHATSPAGYNRTIGQWPPHSIGRLPTGEDSGEDEAAKVFSSDGTVRRKAKRERNRTMPVASSTTNQSSIGPGSSAVMQSSSSKSANNNHTIVSVPASSAATRQQQAGERERDCEREECSAVKPRGINKSRSKSRSPGRHIGHVQQQHKIPSSNNPPAPPPHFQRRGASPDNISESSASFHENEIPHSHAQHCAVHHHHHHIHAAEQQQQQQGPGQQPRLQLFSNRDSVRESWMSSGSSEPYGHHHQHQHHSHSHSQAHASSGGTSDASNKSLSSGGHMTGYPGPRAAGSLASVKLSDSRGSLQASHPMSASSTTLPRSSGSRGRAQHDMALTTAVPSSASAAHYYAKHPQQYQQQHHRPYHTTSRSMSRESGSSSSRTVSRSGSRTGLGMIGNRASSSPAIQKQFSRSATPEDVAQSPVELPIWMDQPSVGAADCTDLECLAIPSRDPADIAAKADAMLANLQQRFKKDQIYTNIGTVLLSINPYKKLPLYTPDVIDIYRCHCLYELPPHIYAVTDRAWRTLRDMCADQCLLFTGESGSGKTEAAKLSLQYLAAVSGHSREFHNIKYQLLQSNTVLEAFGNAKTRLNENSSRFGKYMEVTFDFKGDPTGGLITNYLLEKSRVTRHPMGERNFHIFYQLLAGADVQLLKEFRLQRNTDNYALLRRATPFSSCNASPSVKQKNSKSPQKPPEEPADATLDDRRDFLITKKALEDLGFAGVEIHDIFRIVSAVLKLGNLDFVPTTNMDGTEGCAINNDYELYDVCEILRGEFPSMQAGLTTRSLEAARSDYLVTDLSAGEAFVAIDALCRTLYSRLFTWLVSRINETLKAKSPRKHRTLGLLDLYGFESPFPDTGGFEQLVINFAAEKVQQVMTEWTLVSDQQEYLSEAVEWSQLDYVSNAAVVSMLERGSYGILSLLEEVCLSSHNYVMAPPSNSTVGGGESGSSTPSLAAVSPDDVFLERLAERFGQHSHVQVRLPGSSSGANSSTTTANVSAGDDTSGAGDSSTPEQMHHKTAAEEAKKTSFPPLHCFRIKHFAGTVTYDSRDFVSRNRDALDRELSQAMYECDHPILKVLFPEGNPRRSARRRPATAGTQFKISLGALLNNLSNKAPHFVRCLKPNGAKQSRWFDTQLVQHQINCTGLVATAQLRRHGYVFRLEYDMFLARYKMLSVHTWPHWTAGGSVDGVTCLLRDLPISANEYAFGRTKIFIRTSKTLEILEEFRRERIDELATLIQKMYRGHLGRKRWQQLRDSQIVISSCWKRWKDKSHIIELKQKRQEDWATVIVQKYFRAWQKRRFLLRLAHNLPSESPLSKEWPSAPRHLRETNMLLRKLYHKWRCQRYRQRFDQIARNRMREKVTASIIFKNRKASYPKSISHPFLGDYVRLRQNPQWKKICIETNDQYVVFADIINKITRTGGKFVPILFVISTSSMLIMDQRTMQIKYRIPAAEIFKLSLSPFHDDIAVFHVRATSPTREIRSQPNVVPGCLSSEGIKRKGDFVLQTGHVIEIVTKLFLVVQNATGKPPHVNIATEFEANFGAGSVTFAFKKGHRGGGEAGATAAVASTSTTAPTSSSSSSTTNPVVVTAAEVGHHHHVHHHAAHVKLVKRGNKMEIFL